MCPAPHPDFQHLADYATGKLPQEKATSIAQHLTECPECESTIQALESKSDTLVSGLQVTPPAEPYAGETELRRAVANAAQIPAAGAKPQPHGASPAAEKVSTKGPVKLGPYQLLAKLGEGGMGAVFKARHEHLEKIVAIKVLPKKAMSDPAAVARFRREMKAVGALHHPNIVGAHDAGEQQGVHFLVMEYVEGSDLSSLIKKNGPVTVEQAVSYMQQAAKGLAFAHGKNIVHRDIKPANLLVDGEGTVKILDMGLARLDDGNAANAEANQGLTQTGQVMGTVDYMAPEQAFDTHRADAKADVYSLGCTLYRILTGENAYRGDTVVQKILAHREQPIPSLLKLRADAPAALDALCQRMLAKKPEDRPTMAEVAKELEALALPAPTEASLPAVVIDVAGKETANRRQAAGAKLAAGLAPRSSAGTKPKPQAGGTGRKPPQKAIFAAAAAGAFALIALGVWLVVRNARDEVVAKVEAPPGTRIEVLPGGSVEVVGGPTPAPVATAAVAVPSPPPTFFTPRAAPNSAAAPDGYALSFGDDATVEIPSLLGAIDPAGPVTVECWFYLDREQNKFQAPIAGFLGPPLALSVNAAGSWEFRIETNEPMKSDAEGKLTPAPAGETGGRYVTTNAHGWSTESARRRHLAGVRTGDKVSIYLDGKLAASRDLPPVTLMIKPFQPKPFTLGGKSWEQFFQGRLDEVRVSKSARYVQDFVPQQTFAADAETTALYHFDEGAGNVLRDASGNKHDGKIVGAKWVRLDGGAIDLKSPIANSTSTTPPAGEYALRFGDGATVEMPSLKDTIDPAKPLTVECWVTKVYGSKLKPGVEFTGEVPVLGFNHGPPFYWVINNSGGWTARLPTQEFVDRSVEPTRLSYITAAPNVARTNRGIYIDAGGDLFIRRWHLAMVRTEKKVSFFADGKLRQSIDIPIVTLQPAKDSFLLGGATGTPARFFHGLIDEVRISQAARYEQDFTPPQNFAADPDTTALYHFDEGAGDVLRDASGNNHHGKIVGAKWVRADGSAIPATAATPSGAAIVPRTPLPDGPPGQLPSIPVPENPRMVVVANDGRHVGFMGGPGHPIWLDLTTGKNVWQNTTGHAAYIRGSRLSPDSVRWALVGHAHDSQFAYIRVLRTADGREEWNYLAEGPQFVGVAFSPDGKQLAVGNVAGEVRLFELPGGREVRRWQAHDTTVHAVAYSRDGLRLVTGATASVEATSIPSKQPTLKLWRAADGIEIPEFFRPTEHVSIVDAEVTRDGRFLLLASNQDAAVAWEMQTGAKLALFRNESKGGRGGISEAPSGTHALVGGDTMLIVEPATGRVLLEMRDAESRHIHKPIPTPDGRFAIAWGEKQLRIWRLPPECWAPGISGTAPAAAAASLPTNQTLADPAFQAWLEATQALPADKQLEAVSKKLMELNPSFDGKLIAGDGSSKPKIENGVVTGVGFLTDHVTDIAPVRAFPGLRDLYCRGSLIDNGPTGKLVDLSPLAGLPLNSVIADFNPIQDLTPLRGMQLRSLGITEAKAADLSPLVGMPLEALGMNSAWKVKDISPLRGMPLKKLSMNGKPVSDLSPLAGMRLEGLSFASTQVADISVLRGMPLKFIDLGNTKVTDLSPLHDCKTLKSLSIKNQKIDPAEIRKLQQALPECKIEWDDPATPAK